MRTSRAREPECWTAFIYIPDPPYDTIRTGFKDIDSAVAFIAANGTPHPPEHYLNDNQRDTVRSIAAEGTGVAIRRTTARALEKRDVAKIHGEAFGSAGVTMTLTPTGRAAARRLWQAYAADYEQRRHETSSVAERALARLDRLNRTGLT